MIFGLLITLLVYALTGLVVDAIYNKYGLLNKFLMIILWPLYYLALIEYQIDKIMDERYRKMSDKQKKREDKEKSWCKNCVFENDCDSKDEFLDSDEADCEWYV